MAGTGGIAVVAATPLNADRLSGVHARERAWRRGLHALWREADGELGGTTGDDVFACRVVEAVVAKRCQDLPPQGHRLLPSVGAGRQSPRGAAPVASSASQGSGKRPTGWSGVASRTPGPLVRCGCSGIRAISLSNSTVDAASYRANAPKSIQPRWLWGRRRTDVSAGAKAAVPGATGIEQMFLVVVQRQHQS